MKMTPIRVRAIMAVALVAAVGLSACAKIEKDVGQCEAGVNDISTLSNVPAGNPC